MLKLDLHIHSQYSDDAVGTPEEIIKILRRSGIHGMAITDHNTVEGSLKALKVAPKDFIVISSVEISTADGHLLALNVTENFARGLSAEETVEKILDAGGIAVAPHIFRNMSGIKIEKLEKINHKIPAIEVFNSCSLPKTNLKAARTAKEFNLGGIGGSDTHDPVYAGYAYTVVDSTDMNVDAIISELNKKRTWGEGTVMPLGYRRERMLKSITQFFKRGFKRI
jgi:hypothetical protein